MDEAARPVRGTRSFYFNAMTHLQFRLAFPEEISRVESVLAFMRGDGTRTPGAGALAAVYPRPRETST